jgi:hypothetical protein
MAPAMGQIPVTPGTAATTIAVNYVVSSDR